MVVVSACLLGENCKYNGGNNYDPKVMEFIKGKEVLPVCPEMRAGLGCPRIPVEIVKGIVTDKNGKVVDTQLREAVADILRELEGKDIEYAILKSRSPTCGVRQVYDGTFSGTLIDGSGILAEALQKAGYRVIDAEELTIDNGQLTIVVFSSKND